MDVIYRLFSLIESNYEIPFIEVCTRFSDPFVVILYDRSFDRNLRAIANTETSMFQINLREQSRYCTRAVSGIHSKF